ncbi:hypothetical protein DMC47_42985 [Nostoc sp. 3335mG]|nr:hypothetical protein DMC47_42985 [Nostoc sp. 3335mG]
MTALLTTLARWIALALHGLAARIDAWGARRVAVAGPTVSLNGLSERFPGAPAHWLAALAEHLGEDATALPVEQDSVDEALDIFAPHQPDRETKPHVAQHIRRARPTLIFADRKMLREKSSAPSRRGEPKPRASLSFPSSGAKALPTSHPLPCGIAAKVRLMLIPGGRPRNPVAEAPNHDVHQRPDPALYPERRKAAASKPSARNPKPDRAPVELPDPEMLRRPVEPSSQSESAGRSATLPPPSWTRAARPSIRFPQATASQLSMIHFTAPAASREVIPAASAQRSSWPTLPPSDATIADTHPSPFAGHDDRHEQMVGRWSA